MVCLQLSENDSINDEGSWVWLLLFSLVWRPFPTYAGDVLVLVFERWCKYSSKLSLFSSSLTATNGNHVHQGILLTIT